MLYLCHIYKNICHICYICYIFCICYICYIYKNNDKIYIIYLKKKIKYKT